MDISAVIGVHNHQDNVETIYKELTKVFNKIDKSYEIIFVDDSSDDDTWVVLKRLQKKDPHVKAIRFRRKHGESASLQAGFDHAKGESIFTMSPTMENHPSHLISLIENAEKFGHDMVIGARKGRHNGRPLTKYASHFAHLFINRLIHRDFTDITSPFRYMKKDLVNNIKMYGDNHLILPAIAALYGGKFAEVEIEHGKPLSKSKSKSLGFVEMTKLMFDMMLVKFFMSSMTPPFNATPMRIFGGLGLMSMFGGLVISLYLTIDKIVNGADIGGRPLLSLGILMLIMGALFLIMGFLGELILRSYYEGQNKSVYSVKEKLFG